MRELFREFAASRRRQRAEFVRDTTHAYQVVAIYVHVRAKNRMPTLKSLLAVSRTQPGERQTAGALKATLQLMSEQYGIPLRHRSKRG